MITFIGTSQKEVIAPSYGVKHSDCILNLSGFQEGDSVLVNGNPYVVKNSRIKISEIQQEELHIVHSEFESQENIPLIPDWMSILPPLLAIVMALILKEVVVSLFAGIFLGSAVIGVYTEGFIGIFTGFFRVIEKYIMGALYDTGHLSVITFSVIIGGVVAVISKNGGMQGIVNRIIRFANSTRNAMLTTWALGVGIFFDDYANSLVVGNTMRPLTDKMKISREKLAYIVDSTAAPIAAVAFVTTWIGAELGYISSGVDKINENGEVITEGVYSIFLNSLAYSFYPIFTLAFMLFLIFKGRDFGPMLKYERKARKDGILPSTNQPSADTEMKEFEPVDEKKSRAFNALLPILTIIIGTMLGLVITGFSSLHSELSTLAPDQNFDSWGQMWSQMHLLDNNPESFFQKLGTLVGASDSYQALLWSSLAAMALALILTASQKIMKIGEAVESMVFGFKTMVPAVIILILAWALAGITDDLHTASFITSALGESISAEFLPAITFVLGAFIAFSTGSSWSTMALLYPLILPASWEIAQAGGMGIEESMAIFYSCTASVIAGSVLGDHCSPISDTTILSSLATSCNHINHVRTQMPYALTVGGVSLLAGIIPGAFGVSSFILFPLGIAILFGVVHLVGKRVE